jgi:hypothetical protein
MIIAAAAIWALPATASTVGGGGAVVSAPSATNTFGVSSATSNININGGGPFSVPIYYQFLAPTSGSVSFATTFSDAPVADYLIQLYNGAGSSQLASSLLSETAFDGCLGVCYGSYSGSVSYSLTAGSIYDIGIGTETFAGSLESPDPFDGSITITIGSNPYFVDPVPEPASLSLLGAGLMGLAAMRRRRKLAA